MKDLLEVKDEMTTNFMNDEVIIERYSLDSNMTFDQQFSKVSIENILFGVIAFAIWTFEKLLNLHRKEVNEDITKSRIHTQGWYREKALSYIHGLSLNDIDIYDTAGLTEQQVKAMKIIANAAPVKVRGYLRMKVVKKISEELTPLTTGELNSFSSYINYVADAGTYVVATTGEADDLKLILDIYYNDLVLAGDGSRLDGASATPVMDAIKSYLKSLRFNGSFVESKLEKEIEAMDGITMVKIKGAWSKYGSYTYDSINNPNVGLIDEIRVADAGYMKIDEEFSILNYKKFSDYE